MTAAELTIIASSLATAVPGHEKVTDGSTPILKTGEKIAIPGAASVDHAGFTVPNLEQAVDFFVEVLGAAVVWRVAPIAGANQAETMRDGLNADPRATATIAMLRLGPSNIELLQYDVPGATRTMPLNSALNIGHIAFKVADIDLAGTYLRGKGVTMLKGPRTNAVGANAGQKSWFFLSPWGMAIELVERPERMPYQDRTTVRLYQTPQ